jgi:hypothetical protein
MFKGNGLLAGKYSNVELDEALAVKYPSYVNRGVLILSTDPTAMTSIPFAGVEA